MLWNSSALCKSTCFIGVAAVDFDGSSPAHISQRLKDIQVNDDSEIDWKALTSKASWNYWSSHDVQRRWKGLKEGIDGHENMTFAGELDNNFFFLGWVLKKHSG